jgi:predicted transcriptional regulator
MFPLLSARADRVRTAVKLIHEARKCRSREVATLVDRTVARVARSTRPRHGMALFGDYPECNCFKSFALT